MEGFPYFAQSIADKFNHNKNRAKKQSLSIKDLGHVFIKHACGVYALQLPMGMFRSEHHDEQLPPPCVVPTAATVGQAVGRDHPAFGTPLAEALQSATSSTVLSAAHCILDAIDVRAPDYGDLVGRPLWVLRW